MPLSIEQIKLAYQSLADEAFEIDNLQSLDESLPQSSQPGHYQSSFKLTVYSADELVTWRASFDHFCQQLGCDYCFVSADRPLKAPKLAVFDMDSTLIPMEVIDELAAEAGVKDQVAEITEAAMQGKLDFNQSFVQRLALLKGMSGDAVAAVKNRLSFNLGVEPFIQYLTQGGADVAIASGGFVPFAERLSELAPIKVIKANQLQFKDNQLTGHALAPVVNADVKAEALLEWRQQRNLELGETIAIGDGANDYKMLKAADYGVAYKAKPFLRYRADAVLWFAEMDALSVILQVVCAESRKLIDSC